MDPASGDAQRGHPEFELKDYAAARITSADLLDRSLRSARASGLVATN